MNTVKLLALLLLCALAVAAQTPDPAAPPVVVVQPPSPDPVQVLDPLPDSPSKDSALWWMSVGANVTGTYLKWSSAWKQPVEDLIHAEPSGPYQGRYYVRGSIYDWGTLAITTVTQYLLARKFPSLRKTFAYVNFGTTAAATAQYGYNRTNR